MTTKPLGGKAYGHISHLPGSRLGPGDHHWYKLPHEPFVAFDLFRDGKRVLYAELTERLAGHLPLRSCCTRAAH